jgi:membrane-bound ClpP family serine protease
MTDLSTVFSLLVMGVLLVGIEVTLIPGMGLVGVLGGTFSMVGCYFAWVGHGPLIGMTAVVSSVGIAGTLVWWFSTSRAGKNFILNTELDGDSGAIEEWEQLVGKTGVARAALRPSGIADIEGERVDVVAEDGLWVDAGNKIQVVRITTNSVVVRPFVESTDEESSDPS